MADVITGSFLDRLDLSVSRNNDKNALIDVHETLSYRELDELTDLCAAYILSLSFDRKQINIVPIVAARNVRTVVWMIACVKADVAFLNINSDFPASYIVKTINSLRPPLYIVTDQGVDKAIYQVGCSASVDAYAFSFVNKDGSNIRFEHRDPERAIYAVSTSGTTGVPKITLIPERAFMNYSQAMVEMHALSNECGVALCHLAPNFDVFIKECLIPLQQGMTIRLLSNEEKYNPRFFSHLVNQLSSHWLSITFTLFQTIGPFLEADKIKHLIFVGEALGKLKESTFQTADKVWNEYGPAECTIGFTAHQVTSEFRGSIGTAIKNNELIILDKNLDVELSYGEIGEITLLGKGVGLGYLNSTNTQFEERTIKRISGENITTYCYRANDLGHKDKAGLVYFNGRADRKVKVRGQWVHLQELEKLIIESTVIDEIKIFYHEVFPGERSLVSYLRVEDKKRIESIGNEVSDFLAQRHNRYEIPDYFIPVDNYPYSMNDKLDEKQLIVMCAQYLESSGTRQAVEQDELDGNAADSEPSLDGLLFNLWNKTLQHNNFTVSDSFFNVGGNSLLGYKLLSSLQELGYDELTVKDIHEKDTIVAMARFIEAKGWV